MNSKIDRKEIDSNPSKADLVKPANDPPQELDELVAHAARGNRRAIGAIAIAFGPVLVGIARFELGTAEEAEDLVQDLYELLLQGEAWHFPPTRGRGLSWLRGLAVAMARARRKGGREERKRRKPPVSSHYFKGLRGPGKKSRKIVRRP
jgi:DNA-directed RNA polymerase specialized sigma24 family protein